MGHFLESEKPYQTEFKNSSYFSNKARADGIYKGKPRPFCLPLECAQENLYPAIRGSALEFFAKNAIQWHDGFNDKPSNHLCDSQVCCVNFLFPLSTQPQALASVLHPLFPQIERMLPVEEGSYVSFEWIGRENYLGEKIRGNGRRTRGRNFTSADAIVCFERKDKQVQVVLIEWKYTESYGGTSLEFSENGTHRTQIYQHLFDDPDCPFDKNLLTDFSALFYEPFYQFMRQQFLAYKMETAHELDADIVSLLHIAPAHNLDFRKITSPKLTMLGSSAVGVWKNLMLDQSRFTSISTEELFGSLAVREIPEMDSWLEYLFARYPWLN